MLRRSWTRLVAAIGGGIAVAAVAPALPAVSQASPPMSPPVSVPFSVDVELEPTATLVARGAAANVDVTITCDIDAFAEATVFVSLTQRRGRFVATGSGEESGVQCTGIPTTVEVDVPATLRAFGVGPAFASADVFVNAGDVFLSGSDSDTIRVRRR